MPEAFTIRDAFTHYQCGRQEEAMRVCQIILASEPTHFNALNILGSIQLQQGEYSAARNSLELAVTSKPGNVEAHTNLGSCLDALQQYGDARRCYQRALELNPDYAPALLKMGNACSRDGDYASALPHYLRALSHTQQDPVLHNNCGTALAHCGRYQEALKAYEQALKLQPGYAAALANYASALANLKRFQEAATAYARLLTLEPHHPEALAKGFMARRHICDWRDYSATTATLLAGNETATATPFALLSLTDSGSSQLTTARAFTARKSGTDELPPAPTPRPERHKIRLAYISADFREHPLSCLMAGVFEQQDRNRFELIGVSLHPPDNSAMGQRVSAAFDTWLDVSDQTDRQVAQLLRELNIDIAVDLMGHTRGNRSGILALRPAPLQVNYLGYPGTTGAAFIDYIIADAYLVPEQSEALYSESVARLPNGFQAFDGEVRIDPGQISRSEADLPDDAWVFCGFNASYKINPTLFGCWMQIMQQVPASVLWLLARDQSVRANLQREAAARGVSPQRLIFASQLPYSRHLARLPLADLFLDTFPFNAGTTASDALRMGLPLLTCSGNSFASRMAGSLLNSLGLPELITTNLADYESRAIQLAEGGPLWQQLRQRLRQAQSRASIFNTNTFCRQYEAALLRMWTRCQSGAPAQSF